MRVVRGEKPACSAAYAALTTLPERRQRVQTRKRLTPPFTIARTRCRFGSNRRGDTLCAWLMFRPTTGPFPQTSQRFAIVLNSLLDRELTIRPGGAQDKHRIIPYGPT